jgi:hypothetical protein
MGYDMSMVREDPAEKELVAELNRQFMEAAKRRDALKKPQWGEGELAAHLEAGGTPFDTPPGADPEYLKAQEEVSRLYEAMGAAERGYFRLNIWGMGKYRDAMLGLGVARMDYSGPRWPEFDKARTCWIVEVTQKADLGEECGTGKPGERVLERRSTRVMDPDRWYYDWLEEPKYRTDDYVEPSADVVKLFEAHRQAIEETKRWRPDPQDDFRIPLHKFGSNDGWLVTPEECFFAGNTLKTIREAESERFYTVLGAAGIQGEDGLRYFDRWIEYLLLAVERGGFEVH